MKQLFHNFAVGGDLNEHGERHQTESGVVGAHARVGCPVPDSDEPVAYEHEVGEEEKEAGYGDRCGKSCFVTEEVTECFSEHGGNDHCVNDADDAEYGYIERYERREEEDHAGEKYTAADHTVEFPDALQTAVRYNEKDVTKCEDCRTGNEAPVDHNVTEESKYETCCHGEIELFVCLLGFAGVEEIDESEQSKCAAAGAFQHAHEMIGLIKIVHDTDCGNQNDIDHQHGLLGFFHVSPQKCCKDYAFLKDTQNERQYSMFS